MNTEPQQIQKTDAQEPQAIRTKADTAAKDSLLTPAMEAVVAQYGPAQLRGLVVLGVLATAFVLGVFTGLGRDPPTAWVQYAVIIAALASLVTGMRWLRLHRVAEPAQALAEPHPYPVPVPAPTEPAEAVHVAETIASADKAAETRCTNPATHNFPNLKASTRCRWCGKTAEKVVKAYLRGA